MHASSAGHNAVHVTDLGLRGTTDEALLAKAAHDDRVIVTADTDFGTLLALTGASEPSVILLRRIGRRTTERTHIVLTVLALAGEHLERGGRHRRTRPAPHPGSDLVASWNATAFWASSDTSPSLP